MRRQPTLRYPKGPGGVRVREREGGDRGGEGGVEGVRVRGGM